MNAERLHIISLAVLNDLGQTKAENILSTIIQLLQNQINQPQQPAFQQQISNNLETLYTALSDAPSNEFSPAWRLALEEIGEDSLLGKKLKLKVQTIFERNQITPSVALNEIRSLFTALNKFRIALEQIVAGCQHLKIGKEDLEQGQCELGILIPRSFVENKLENLGKEFNELHKIFGIFSELVTGSRPGFEIRSVSSSEFFIFLAAVPGVVACIAQIVEKIITSYKNLLEIRKYHKELHEHGVAKKDLKGIEDHSNKIMESTIQELVKDLLNKYWKKKDEGRRNELAVELKLSLDKIANRIDKGYNIEIRVEPIHDDKKEGVEESKSTENLEYIKIIQSAAKTLQFLKFEGEPILSLPESENEQEKKTKK